MEILTAQFYYVFPPPPPGQLAWISLISFQDTTKMSFAKRHS